MATKVRIMVREVRLLVLWVVVPRDLWLLWLSRVAAAVLSNADATAVEAEGPRVAQGGAGGCRHVRTSEVLLEALLVGGGLLVVLVGGACWWWAVGGGLLEVLQPEVWPRRGLSFVPDGFGRRQDCLLSQTRIVWEFLLICLGSPTRNRNERGRRPFPSSNAHYEYRCPRMTTTSGGLGV